MSTVSSPSDPNASEDLPNVASLAIMILLPLNTFSDPAPNIPSTSNASPSGVSRTETFDIEIVLGGALRKKINDEAQWDVKELIDPDLLIDAGLATVLAVVSYPSLQGSQESPNPFSPGHNDSSCSSGSVDDFDASESEEDSDDSSPVSLPLRQQTHEHDFASLSEGANSSLSNPLCATSITDPNAEPFTWMEDSTSSAQERVVRTALDDTNLGADVVDGSGVNIEVGGVPNEARVTNTEEMAVGGRVEIPIDDEADR
ncbi:hypothetical protein Dimus_001450 [Dionaea muscipula]